MRDFADIQRELALRPFLDSANGSLHYVPDAPDAPDLLVRRFDRELMPAMIPTYVDLLAAAQRWIAADPELAQLVRIEQPSEVGRDFIARPYLNATSLDAYLAGDPEDDPPEPPDELPPMQAGFRVRIEAANGPREELLTTILARSLLAPTHKTMYIPAESRFVVVDLKPTQAELERWRELAATAR
jgi:hypothetical protein